MAARTDVQASPETLYLQRRRSVWAILALSTALFCMVCSASGMGLYGYLSTITQPRGADMQPVLRADSLQLSVVRNRATQPEAVIEPGTVVLNEGDRVKTGPDTEANIDLFDGSTVHLYFDSEATLSKLRTSSFIGNRKDVSVDVESGTVVVSTADEGGFSSAEYRITTPDAEIEVAPNSTLRVLVDAAEGNGAGDTQAIVTVGKATVMAGGERVEVRPGEMSVVAKGEKPEQTRRAEQELVRNGDFRLPPTAQAEYVEKGGLGTAAWLPIREQSEEATDAGEVKIESEDVPGQTVRAASISRGAPKDAPYARVGIRQEINAPVSFQNSIEFRASVKLLEQIEPAGGRSGDVYPLTVRVLYSDPSGRQQEWRRNFYLWKDGSAPLAHAVSAPLGTWFAPDENYESEFILKGTKPGAGGEVVGQDIAVINALEIYGIGTTLKSWITDVSLVAR